MAAVLLAEGRSTITNVPDIQDVWIMSELLRRLGCAVDYDVDAASVHIDVPAAPAHQADYDLVRAMRASISVLGRWWPAAARPKWRCPGETPSAAADWICTGPGWSKWVRGSASTTGIWWPRRRTDCTAPTTGCPIRRSGLPKT